MADFDPYSSRPFYFNFKVPYDDCNVMLDLFFLPTNGEYDLENVYCFIDGRDITPLFSGLESLTPTFEIHNFLDIDISSYVKKSGLHVFNLMTLSNHEGEVEARVMYRR